MSKRTRTILFIICVVIFALATPVVVFYSQGYRFDFETKKIVQTGAFYFKVSPRNAEIYLNNKPKAKTSIFTNSALIENLVPKTYGVEIKKQGYYTWQKNLEVKERQVTEAKNVVLIPENPNFIILATSTKEILDITSKIEMVATSSDKNKLIEFNDYEIWISLIKKTIQSQTEQEEKIFITRFSEKIDKVFWLNDYYLIFNVGNKIKVAEIDDRDRINIVDLVEFENPEIFWSEKAKKLYVLSQDNLYLSENLLP